MCVSLDICVGGVVAAVYTSLAGEAGNIIEAGQVVNASSCVLLSAVSYCIIIVQNYPKAQTSDLEMRGGDMINDIEVDLGLTAGSTHFRLSPPGILG